MYIRGATPPGPFIQVTSVAESNVLKMDLTPWHFEVADGFSFFDRVMLVENGKEPSTAYAIDFLL